MRKSFGILSLGVLVVMGAACNETRTVEEPTSAAPAAAGSASAAAGSPSAASAAERDMIVILRDQMPAMSSGRGARRVRANAIAAAQAPILGELQAAKPRQARSFEMVNGFATKLSQAEVDRVSARSEVLAVVPDRVIAVKRRAHSVGHTKAADALASASAGSLCNTLEPEALQLTNTAFLDPTTPQAQEVIDGAGRKVTGQGVKVAFLADGIDTNVPGFTRPDGSKVFVDYQNFTGDPAGTPTAGGEAFGDASSIAAQDMPNGTPLTFDISSVVSWAHPLASPCNIRIRGMAPGASLVGIDIYSDLNYSAFASTWVQAIDWAVVHDEVDVINESFGSNVYPDDSTDPISLANLAAVRAGVTVVASSGDAAAGTFASPADDSWVIGVGATTQFRLYAQTGLTVPFATGFIDGNLSGFSSSGFAQKNASTLSLVAPGDLGWALCSTNPKLYTDCTDFQGRATPIQDFGGTSESAPITAGAAALVIQAYRSTHGGVSPSPALVKSILMSSASDIGAPSDEQGAGFLDALKAVNTALSVADENGRPAPQGVGLLTAPTSAEFTALPGDPLERTFQVTNTGTKTLEVRPALESLAAPMAGGTFNFTLTPGTEPAFIDGYGWADTYVTQTFTVPEGAEHLDAEIAWQGTLANQDQTTAQIYLLDPTGKLAAFSIPQGAGSSYGHVDVVKPATGVWTAVVSTPGYSPYSGPVQLTWSAERFASVGEAFPSRLTLAPGASAWVAAAMRAPSQPGDSAAALRLHSGSDSTLSEIPFTVRTLIPVGPRGGTFDGTLTGGNGRQYISPATTYAFDVPEGVRDLSLSLEVADKGYLLAGYLVDPNGMILSSDDDLDPSGVQQGTFDLLRLAPQPGRWRFILLEPQASGNQTSISFTARIAFNTMQVSATGLPTSARTVLSASQPAVAVPVTVTNTAASAKAFFADARLDMLADVTLVEGGCGEGYSTTSLPAFCAIAAVPPHASGVRFIAQSPVPIAMDAMAYNVTPVISAQQTSEGLVASIQERELPFGPWYIFPALLGPFGPAGAPTVPVATTTVATMQPFDSAIASDTGNYWILAATGTGPGYTPLVLAPGASGTINLTLTPDPSQVGKTVRGFVYVDTVNVYDGYGTGDEAAELPYEYTVGE